MGVQRTIKINKSNSHRTNDDDDDDGNANTNTGNNNQRASHPVPQSNTNLYVLSGAGSSANSSSQGPPLNVAALLWVSTNFSHAAVSRKNRFSSARTRISLDSRLAASG